MNQNSNTQQPQQPQQVAQPGTFITFDHVSLITMAEDLLQECLKMMRAKNKDYAGGKYPSGLGNFYRTADECNITPLQAWRVHSLKHDIALEKVWRGDSLTLASESVSDRIIDRINYTVLFRALLMEGAQLYPKSKR